MYDLCSGKIVYKKNNHITMQIKTFVIDAFTDTPFSGNPAGICWLEAPLPVETMQSIAAEINLSETGFIRQSETDATHYSIRYFTPTVEIPFCGHATLAASKLILQKRNLPAVHFTTFHGLKLSAGTVGKSVRMVFPLYQTLPHTASQALLSAVGIEQTMNIHFSPDIDMLLIEVADKKMVMDLTPDFVKMLQAPDAVKVVVVTTRSTDAQHDFYSRCFCPWLGINEDPVTGAVHTALASYWGKKLGKTSMNAFQCSKRGGFMHLHIVDQQTLEVTSEAQIMIEGLLTL